MGVGILWFYTEMLYARKPIDEDLKLRLSKVVHRIDGATLLFFLGILWRWMPCVAAAYCRISLLAWTIR